jgi:hypothetical protein
MFNCCSVVLRLLKHLCPRYNKPGEGFWTAYMAANNYDFTSTQEIMVLQSLIVDAGEDGIVLSYK